MNWFRPGEAPKEAANDPRALRGDTDVLATAVTRFMTKTGLFDRDYYIATYPDVLRSGIDPLHHFMRIGIQAGATFASHAAIARIWREVLQDTPPRPDIRPPANPERLRVALYVSSLGNFFMTEIAGVLQAGFADAGIAARILTDNDQPAADATHHVVVAPHEFFVLGQGKRFATDDFVSRAIMYATEQVQTPWFARSLAYLLRARAVADLNEQTACVLRRGGVRAVTVQPGFSAAFTPFGPQVNLPARGAFESLPAATRDFDVTNPSFAARPLDVLFLGTMSPRREKVLATFAPKFASLATYLYATRMTRPIDRKLNPTAAPEVTAALLQRSKVLLNVHRDDNSYFEWWRLMQAFWQKTLVVTEPCVPHALFRPGVHYLEEAPRHIPHLVDWLARSPDGQARADGIRQAAYALLTTEATARNAALTLLRAAEAA
jgi:hypothetical protein